MRRLSPPVVAGIAAAVVLAGLTAAALRPRDGRTALATRDEPVTETTAPAPEEIATPSPTTEPTATPAATATAAATGEPVTPTAARTTTSTALRPLPSPCLSYGNYCAYPGSKGRIDGPEWVGTTLVARDVVRMTWRPSYAFPTWPQPDGFLAQAYRYGPEDLRGDVNRGMVDPDHLTRVRLPFSTRTWTFRDLVAGARYEFCVYQLNSDGMGGTCGDSFLIAAEPTPSPTAPAPTTSATPTAEPSESVEPTASATTP
jgi:hypothetical protein